MGKNGQQKGQTVESIREKSQNSAWYSAQLVQVLLCPYEDETLAFWMKLVFGFIWAVSIPNGLLFGADRGYFAALAVMVGVLALDIVLYKKYRKRWMDVVTFLILCLPVFYVYAYACVGYFSMMFPLIYACGVVFVLGIRGSFLINAGFLVLITVCFRADAGSPVRARYGDNVALRFPYLFICIVLVAYCLMYMIQSYWVEKRRRTQILEKRIADERHQLDTMSMKVMNAMVHALGAKIPGEEEHCRCVAEYAREIAVQKGLDRQQCADAYSAGLLHEIGMIGIPDALVCRPSLTDEEYEVFQTYVEKGYKIISTLQSADTSQVAEAVRYHRESYDGSGFLEGLRGEEIPVLARVLAVADYADRHMRRGESVECITGQLLTEEAGRFEPESARIMVQLLSKV